MINDQDHPRINLCYVHIENCLKVLYISDIRNVIVTLRNSADFVPTNSP